jgi:hypothetical protein
MMGRRSLVFAGLFSASLVVAGCSSGSDDGARHSPDGGASTGGKNAQGGDATGGRSSATGGTSADGGSPENGGTSGAGSGGASPDDGGGPVLNCTPGCKMDCPQGCFDLGDCTGAEAASLALHANVFTAGVVATSIAGAADAALYYRPAGAAFWWKGQNLSRLPDGRYAGSAFYLSAATEYAVRVVSGEVTACATTTTQPAMPAASAMNETWVDAGATAGGDGSSARPYRTIQDAVKAAKTGTDIRVRAGVYREQVVITAKSTGTSYLRIRGETGAILDGSDPDAAAGKLSWSDETGGVYSTAWSGDPRYVSREGARLYHYVTRGGLDAGLGFNDVPIAEGFFVQGGRLYVRSNKNPSGQAFQIPLLNTAIQVSSAEGVWLEGLEVRFYGEGDYGKGIDVTENSTRVVISNNHVHDIPTPVWIRKGSSEVRIEDNELAQSTVFSWPWSAVKATDHENDAVTLAGGTGAIVARNRIHDVFNGVYAGSFDDDHDAALAFDVDVYRNRLARIGDDGFEPEGAGVNTRFWENTVDAVHNGLSLAPITFGPVYAFKNRFTDYQESGFKVSNDTSGPVFLFHNTCYTDAADHNGMNVSGNFSNVTFRNNVIRGTSYAIESTLEVSSNDLDYDALFTTRGAPRMKWNDVRYDDLAALCSATTLECHGVGADPALVAPGDGKFAPGPASPLIDTAVRLYGINDEHAGASPDIGYVEAGTTEVPRL